MMKDNIPYELISKNLSGESSTAEDAALFEWIEADPNHREIFDNLVVSFGGQAVEITSEELDKRMEQVHSVPLLRKTIPLWMKVAASVVIVAGFIQFLVTNRDEQTLRTSSGEVRKFILPDSSEVWLNGLSEVRYHIEDFEKNRKVHLSGEAYFKVRYQSEKFTVVYDSIEALLQAGEVNIDSYRNSREQIATVSSGVVEFKARHQDALTFKGTDGDEVVAIRGYGLFSLTQTNNINYSSWITGLYAFDQVPAETIAFMINKGWKDPLLVLSDSSRFKLISGIYRLEDRRVAAAILSRSF